MDYINKTSNAWLHAKCIYENTAMQLCNDTFAAKGGNTSSSKSFG